VVGSLAQSYGIEEGGASLGEQLHETLTQTSGGYPGAAAFAFMVFVLGYTPCLATVAEQWRLLGRRWTLSSVGIQLVVAWLLAVTAFNVGRLL
jgi:ferrous iron transport protein B